MYVPAVGRVTSIELPVRFVKPLIAVRAGECEGSGRLPTAASRSNWTWVVTAAENVHWSIEYGVVTVPVMVWFTFRD